MVARVREIHLIVLQHGMWGSPADLGFVEEMLKRTTDPRRVVILNSGVNTARLTYDGIDVLGDRLANLVSSYCARLQEGGFRRVWGISFICYSLGGLIARYAIGKLAAAGFFQNPAASCRQQPPTPATRQPPPMSPRPTLITRSGILWGGLSPQQGPKRRPQLTLPSSSHQGVVPVNFVTFASPHLGSWHPPDSYYRTLFNAVLPYTLSRTGSQLVLADNFVDGLPLLVVMASAKYAFHAGLGLFQKRLLLANVRHDATVPYSTSSITKVNPYEHDPGRPISTRYPCIVVPTDSALAGSVTVAHDLLGRASSQPLPARIGDTFSAPSLPVLATGDISTLAGSSPWQRSTCRTDPGYVQSPSRIPAAGLSKSVSATGQQQQVMGQTSPGFRRRSCSTGGFWGPRQTVPGFLYTSGSGSSSANSSHSGGPGEKQGGGWLSRFLAAVSMPSIVMRQSRRSVDAGKESCPPTLHVLNLHQHPQPRVRSLLSLLLFGGHSSQNSRATPTRAVDVVMGARRHGSGAAPSGWPFVQCAGSHARPGEHGQETRSKAVVPQSSSLIDSSSLVISSRHGFSYPAATSPDAARMLPAPSSRLRGDVFACMLPLLVIMWGCMLVWLLLLSAHHYLLLPSVKRDRAWDVRWQGRSGRIRALQSAQMQLQQAQQQQQQQHTLQAPPSPSLSGSQSQSQQELLAATANSLTQAIQSAGTQAAGQDGVLEITEVIGALVATLDPSSPTTQSTPADAPHPSAPMTIISMHPQTPTPGVIHLTADCSPSTPAPSAQPITSLSPGSLPPGSPYTTVFPTTLLPPTSDARRNLFDDTTSGESSGAITMAELLPTSFQRTALPTEGQSSVTRVVIWLSTLLWQVLVGVLQRGAVDMGSSWWEWLTELWEVQLPSLEGTHTPSSLSSRPSHRSSANSSNQSQSSNHSGGGGRRNNSGNGGLDGGQHHVSVAANGDMRQAEQLRFMCEQLNLLTWHRADVDTRHYHAHAAIVVRSAPRFASTHAHVVEYAIRQMREI